MIPRGGLDAGGIAGEEDEEKEEEEKEAAAAADARRDDEPGGSCICSGDRSTSCCRKATRLDGLSGGGMTAGSRHKKLGM